MVEHLELGPLLFGFAILTVWGGSQSHLGRPSTKDCQCGAFEILTGPQTVGPVHVQSVTVTWHKTLTGTMTRLSTLSPMATHEAGTASPVRAWALMISTTSAHQPPSRSSWINFLYSLQHTCEGRSELLIIAVDRWLPDSV